MRGKGDADDGRLVAPQDCHTLQAVSVHRYAEVAEVAAEDGEAEAARRSCRGSDCCLDCPGRRSRS